MTGNDNPFERLLEPLVGIGVPASVERRQARQDELAGRVDSGVDPDYIQGFENFHSMDHAAIYRLAQTISPVAMTTLATEWAKLGRSFSLTVSLGTVMIRDKIAQHWEGDAATAAASATKLFGESAQQLCDAAQAVSEKLRIAADVGERVKASIPPPTVRIPLPIDVMNPISDADAARQAEAVRAQAVQVMEALYKPYYRDSGAAVPVLPAPYEATAGQSGGAAAAWSSNPRDRSGGNSPVSEFAAATGNTPGAPGDFAGGTSGTDDMSAQNRGAGTPVDETVPVGATTAESAATEPASTAPAASAGGPATSSQPYGSPAYGSSTSGTGLHGGSSAGTAAGSGGSTSSPWGSGVTGGIGATGPGTPGAGHPGQPPGSTATRNAAMRPMGMYPGMMPPGSARNGDEDRRLPSYLVTNDNGNELIGAIPDTAPPVLGVDPA